MRSNKRLARTLRVSHPKRSVHKNMKRPKLIYAIAVWTFFQQTFFLKLPLMMLFQRAGVPMEQLIQTRNIVSVIFLFALVFLVKLSGIARWVVVSLLGLATLLAGKVFITFTLMGHQMATRAYVTFPLMILGNIACIIYLSRPAFGQLVREFQEQKRTPSLDDINAELIKKSPKIGRKRI